MPLLPGDFFILKKLSDEAFIKINGCYSPA